MSTLVIPDLDDGVLATLRARAGAAGRTPEDEAKAILITSLGAPSAGRDLSVWESIDAFHADLVASGRKFSDSTELIREDRDR